MTGVLRREWRVWVVVAAGFSGILPILPLRLDFVLASLVLAAAILGWLLRTPDRWIAAFLVSALVLPPLPIELGNSGPHVCLLAALVGLLSGAATRWRIPAGELTRAFLFLFFVLLCSTSMAALVLRHRDRGREPGARHAAGNLDLSFLSGCAPPSPIRARTCDSDPSAVYCRNGVGVVCVPGLLLPFSRPGRLRPAIRVAVERRFPPRARDILRGQHLGQPLRFLPDHDRRGLLAREERAAPCRGLCCCAAASSSPPR